MAQARNQCDAILHSAKSAMEESGGKLSDEEKESIETAIKEAEEARAQDDIEVVKEKTQALMAAAGALAQQAQNGGGDDGGGGEENEKSGGGDSAVDAEFQEIDGDEKRK